MKTGRVGEIAEHAVILIRCTHFSESDSDLFRTILSSDTESRSRQRRGTRTRTERTIAKQIL